jgi:hypothetical protein
MTNHPTAQSLKVLVRQRGVVAIIVGISLVALIGAGGLALDLSRLYINKTVLQSTADACALAAAGELICPPGTPGCLLSAQARGLAATARNEPGDQSPPATVTVSDIRFSANFVPNSAYLPASAAPPGSRFAMCIARSGGITPWLMGVLGVGTQNVSAQAVATLGPGASICPGVPIGACPRSGGGSYSVGDWVAASHNDSVGGGGPGNNDNNDNADRPDLGNPNGNYGTNVKGSFRWVDWDPSAGGVNELRPRLAGATFCGVAPSTTDVGEAGDKQGAKSAFNTRFGLYPNGANAYSVQTAPPDRTGFSYPTRNGGTGGSISVGESAFANYMTHYAASDPYQGRNGPGGYDGGGRPAGTPATAAQHAQYGSHRRLVTLPMLNDCSSVGGTKSFSTMGCFLLLNPMANGNNGDVFMEYRGGPTDPNSPCASGGTPGGPGSTAGLVPTLVQ